MNSEKKMFKDAQDDVLPVGRPRPLICSVPFWAEDGLFDLIRPYIFAVSHFWLQMVENAVPM
jgi:hypothetical protein